MNKEQLLDLLQNNFKEIVLAEGIGIWEAEAIDNYLVGQEYENLKSKDERVDWNKISFDFTSQFEWTFPFWDTKGTLFILPKVLQITLLLEDTNEDQLPDWQYILNGIYEKGWQTIFSQEQKDTIVHFLDYQKKRTSETYLENAPHHEIDQLRYKWKE